LAGETYLHDHTGEVAAQFTNMNRTENSAVAEKIAGVPETRKRAVSESANVTLSSSVKLTEWKQ